ncbi:hypothetical protein [Aurantimonas sp. Leaf443]|uniref:spermidine synthase n=1 Tax=Aurantimonas sp. Leaf443 TaxID=1736378 RepID=UPI0006F96E94|nr:hypothetical protein [Aurantimonas sp. Leaf443]KQT85495.1 hypothetical protein ASG48_09745 [Aurantimonas sp. Leaf443]
MIPWVQIDTAEIPGEAGTLRLMRRGTEFSIMIGGNELMNSRLSGSEEALATLTATALGERPAPSYLIGGLGMGFTLRAALSILPPTASVTVCELVPAVAAWASGPLAPVFGRSLDDRRVELVTGDVGATIASAKDRFDAILLDVDNGPAGLTRAANGGLYSTDGLAAARNALRPGGILAVWSSAPAPSFGARLKRSGFSVTEETVRAGRGSGARHVIWLARRA